MGPLSVRVTDSLDGLESLGDRWNGLLENAAADSVFLTWEWLSSWARTYLGDSRRPLVVELCDGTELVGLAPWCLRSARVKGLPVRLLEFLGTPETGSDYLDVIALKGREQEVADRLFDLLWGDLRGAWDLCLWQDLPADSYFLMYFSERSAREGKHLELRVGSFCPSASLPAEPEAYLARLSPSRRKRFEYDWRVLNREVAVEHRSASGAGLGEELLDRFFELYSRVPRDERNLRAFLDTYRSRGGAETLRLDCLCREEALIAGLLHLRHRGTTSLYLMATDREYNPKVSVGNVLVGLSIQDAIRAGSSTYDFLKGVEPYKFSWSDKVRSTVQVRLYRRGLAPLLCLGGSSIRSLFKCVAR